jgi:hypothetical protein
MLCGNKFTVNDKGKQMFFNSFIPGDNDVDAEIKVCGRCHLLTAIYEQLRELNKKR